MKELALIGPTACGKSDLAIELAQKHNAFILSLDSLAIYKFVDIASAKPSKEELRSVKHFGIDIIMPDSDFNATLFFEEYENAKNSAIKAGKNLIIVGGSSFYLKAMIDGLTDMPKIGKQARESANRKVAQDTDAAYNELWNIDRAYAQKIKPKDSYRIARGLEIFYEFKKTATQIFESLPKKKVAEGLLIFEIAVDREILRERIKKRVSKMMREGIVDETKMLLEGWGSETKPIKSIGPKECLSFLRGEIKKDGCEELISIHTAQLAKRQVTFNKTQLCPLFRGERDEVKNRINELFS